MHSAANVKNTLPCHDMPLQNSQIKQLICPPTAGCSRSSAARSFRPTSRLEKFRMSGRKACRAGLTVSPSTVLLWSRWLLKDSASINLRYSSLSSRVCLLRLAYVAHRLIPCACRSRRPSRGPHTLQTSTRSGRQVWLLSTAFCPALYTTTLPLLSTEQRANRALIPRHSCMSR